MIPYIDKYRKLFYYNNFKDLEKFILAAELITDLNLRHFHGDLYKRLNFHKENPDCAYPNNWAYATIDEELEIEKVITLLWHDA